MRRTAVITLLLTLLSPCLLAVAQTPAAPKPGELGYQPPEVLDVIVPDTVAHQDEVGGSFQSLLGLSGAVGGGFGAVWRDTRDGTLGLYFARLDGDGKPRESERSICTPHTMRRTDAVIAVAPDGHGAIAWTSVFGRGAVPFVRTFDAAGVIFAGERRLSEPVEAVAGDMPRGGRGDDDASCREPALVMLADGRTAIVWTRGGRMQWLVTSRDGDPEGPVVDLDATLPAAEPGVRLALGADGVVACLWRAKGGAAHVTLRRERRAISNAIGSGIPRAIAADLAGGYWTLVVDEGRSRVQHLGVDGKPDRAPSDIVDGRDPQAALVAFEGGVAVLERPTNTAEGKGIPRVWLFDSAGAGLPGSPVTIPSAAARDVVDARIASSGARLLVAWTDGRDGDPNVYARLVDTKAAPAERLSAERRINTDTASANQSQPAIASSGAHGAMVWTDERGVPSRIYLRRFTATGLAEHELVLPVPTEGAPAVPAGGALRPAVGVRANGDALACWRVIGERNQGRLVAQIIALDGHAVSPLLDIDDGSGDPPLDPAVAALSGERGFALAWPRGGAGSVQVRLVSPSGALGTVRAVSVSRPPDAEVLPCADVDVAELESGRILCAWTLHRPPTACSIRGRFLSDALAPIGDELGFDGTERGGDWDPAIAPALGGGFVLSWTSGPVSDPVREAVARLFDGRARPSAPLQTVCFGANEQDFTDVVRLADGSFAVAWEDDISYWDMTYMRRLSRDGRTLGPMMRINALETEFVPDRVAPRLAAIGGGFAAVFSDRRRSRGFDAIFKLVGPAFDGAGKR